MLSTDSSPSQWRLWRSICSWLATITLDRLMVGSMLIIIFAAAACTGMQSDSWWQLRAGAWIVETRQVWLIDPFSSTAYGAPWPNHEWLSQVMFYIVYRAFGLPALVVLCALIATATWWIIYQICPGIPRYRVLALLAAVITHEIVWAVRPHMISLLLLALTILLIQRRRFRWWLPAVFLLWANLHGGVVIGGAVLIVATSTALLFQRRDFWHWMLITSMCALATLINPMGFGLWRFALSMFDHPETEYIQEWLPPSLHWGISYPFFILGIIWILTVVLRWRKLKGFDDWMFVLLGFIFLLLGSRAIRHTPLFAVAALPLVLRVLPEAPIARSSPNTAQLGAFHLVLGGLVTLSGCLLITHIWNDPRRMAWEPLAPPIITAIRSCPGPLYNTYGTGGPLMWFVPERPVFVDSRNDPYPLQLLFRAVIAEQQGDYQQLFQEYNIVCALVPVERPIYSALRQDRMWQELYRDSEMAVMQHNNADLIPLR